MLSPQTLMASQAKGSPSTPLPGRAWSPALGPPQDPPLWTVLPPAPKSRDLDWTWGRGHAPNLRRVVFITEMEQSSQQ